MFCFTTYSTYIHSSKLFLLLSIESLLFTCAPRTTVAQVETIFSLDPTQSSLTIAASTVFIVPLEDSDTQPLEGSIDVAFDFGADGALPAAADLFVFSGQISPLRPFALTLGAPPLGVDVNIVETVADVRTPTPPAALTRLSESPAVYEFDAAELEATLNQGSVVVSGALNRTFDLAAMPVAGTADPGTLGSITLTPGDVSGPYTLISGLLELPLDFTSVIEAEGQLVTLDVDGVVIAGSDFYAALAGLPGDFNDDQDVDGGDLPEWKASYGPVFTGRDLLDWQSHFGIAPPPLPAVQTVPEPTTSLLWLAACGLGSFKLRRSVN